MLWFGVTILDGDFLVGQEMHGPYEDAEAMTEAADERVEEATREGHTAVPISFELCTDDVPEIVEYESAGH